MTTAGMDGPLMVRDRHGRCMPARLLCADRDHERPILVLYVDREHPDGPEVAQGFGTTLVADGMTLETVPDGGVETADAEGRAAHDRAARLEVAVAAAMARAGFGGLDAFTHEEVLDEVLRSFTHLGHLYRPDLVAAYVVSLPPLRAKEAVETIRGLVRPDRFEALSRAMSERRATVLA